MKKRSNRASLGLESLESRPTMSEIVTAHEARFSLQEVIPISGSHHAGH
jgi:hypothetical protein